MARISVIMGIYNCASTLVEALDSLYAQTYQDFKIILCEDGSTDNTYEVAQRYAKEHKNIMLLRNERNMGLNYTLNRCLEHADTEYVARMDGDDISLPTRFEKELDFLDAHPEYAFVSTPMFYFDSDGIYETRTSVKGGEPSSLDFLYGKSFCHAPLLIRSSAIIDVGGYSVSPYLLRVEDRHLWYKLYMKNYKGCNLYDTLYMMRDDRNAKSRRTFSNRRNEAYMGLLYCIGFNLPWWHYPECIIVPLLKWLLPNWLYNLLHKVRK